MENKNIDSCCKQAILEIIATIETQIVILEKEIDEHVNNHLYLKSMIENIKTVKGVGHLTAVAVVAEMPSVDNFMLGNSQLLLISILNIRPAAKQK